MGKLLPFLSEGKFTATLVTPLDLSESCTVVCILAFDFPGFRSQLSIQYLWAFCPVFSAEGMNNGVHLISVYILLVTGLESFPFQISDTNINNYTRNT